jgi:hypothetical protein
MLDQILTFLSKPIILTTLTLSVGSYLFTKLSERRSRNEKIREKALQLLEDVGADVNTAISLIYRHIRNSNFRIEKDSPLNEKRAALFTKRFGVRIRSKVFLKSEEFWPRYDQLTFEIDRIVRFIGSLASDYELEGTITQIAANRQRFAEVWPCEDRTKHSQYQPPADELVKWADMVWDRANWLITMNLEKIFR